MPDAEKKAAANTAKAQKPVCGQVRMDEIPQVAAKPAPAKKAVPAAAKPVPQLLHDEPEGTISTQGESRAEHAQHRRRILEEEARLQAEKDALEELRSANLEKLRSAVIMSEVLGKPVALRGRRR